MFSLLGKLIGTGAKAGAGAKTLMEVILGQSSNKLQFKIEKLPPKKDDLYKT